MNGLSPDLLHGLPGLESLHEALDLPPGARVVVAMSGGVDSSATAGLLKALGFDVVGVTLHLNDQAAAVVPGSRTCCAGRDLHDARRVADRLGIPHYVVDAEAAFRNEVVDAFAASYAAGETPVPCVLCNQTVKFRDLLGMAQDLGAAALLTGHYARRVRGADGRAELWRGADARRDQSYFLYATTKAQADYLRFPLGDLSKDVTREIARRLGLAVASKPDSQDICFVPDGDYAGVVRRLRPEAFIPGDIVHVDGRVLGRHEGIVHFTVGQRRGLAVGGTAERLYVVRIDAAAHRVIAGPREALGVRHVSLRAVNWLGRGDAPPTEGLAVTVKVRHAFTPAPAMIYGRDDGSAEVVLDPAVDGVAPGQACVVYDGERLLGGGWITGTTLRTGER